jgi:hypothetical protein
MGEATMVRSPDPYEVLGVSHAAGVEEIRAAFRRAALHYHPDQRPENVQEAARRFHEVCQAYRLLLRAHGPVITPQQLARRDEPWFKLGLPRQTWWDFRHQWQATDGPPIAREIRPRVDEPVVFGLCLVAAALLAGLITQIIHGWNSAAELGSLPTRLLLAAAIYLPAAAGIYFLLVASRTVIHILSRLYLHGRLCLPRPMTKLPRNRL